MTIYIKHLHLFVRKNARNLSMNIISSEKRTVSLGSLTPKLKENCDLQVKWYFLSNILCSRRDLKIGEYHSNIPSFSWGIFHRETRFRDQSRANNKHLMLAPRETVSFVSPRPQCSTRRS